MKYRDIDYTVVQGIGRQLWKWSVSFDANPARGEAATALVPADTNAPMALSRSVGMDRRLAFRSETPNRIATLRMVLGFRLIRFAISSMDFEVAASFSRRRSSLKDQRAFFSFRTISLSPSGQIDRAMTFIGKLGDIIQHLDEAKFNQRHKIVLADGQKLRSPGFDIAQRPAQTYRNIEIQAVQH